MPIKMVRSVFNEVAAKDTGKFGEVAAHSETVTFDATDSHYSLGEGFYYIHSNPKLWFKRPPKDYLLAGLVAHAGRKEFAVEHYVRHHDFPQEFAGTKYERPPETGGYDCFSKTVEGVIDCVEQKYGVKVEIKGITMEELKRRAQETVEEWISPKPQEFSFFDLMDSTSDKVLEDMVNRLDSFCTTAEIGRNIDSESQEFAVGVCRDVLKNLVRDLSLNVSNENWDEYLMRGVVKTRFRTMLNNLYEYHNEECDEAWGVAVKEPERVGKTKVEKFVDELWNVAFDEPRMEELRKIGDDTARKLEARRCKDMMKGFLSTYSSNMKKIIEQLR